jgi:hypothetical protein
LSIFNKTDSVTSFKTLQNGGVRPYGNKKKNQKLCQNALEQKIAHNLYFPNLSIFSKTNSVTSFKTLQNGGVRPYGIQKKTQNLKKQVASRVFLQNKFEELEVIYNRESNNKRRKKETMKTSR